MEKISSLSGFKRTHYCGTLRAGDIGKNVSVCGWVARSRNLGGLLFVALRDREGIIQCVFDESQNKELFDLAFPLRSEWVIAVEGVVRSRGDGAVNPNMPTGEIEVLASSLRVFSKSETTPFEIVENSDAGELLRLKYRYLDLRRPELQNIIALRHRALQSTRGYFSQNGFYEIETPMLTKSTPEGARDYIVPSRLHEGMFYALPQSPQQYKQLLMLSGFDRYMQVVRCFRDEDLRADRQPEFTQVDLEMSFSGHEDVFSICEGYIKTLFKETINTDIETPFRRMPWKEAMETYGTDKPDLRFGFEIINITDIAKNCGFKVFSSAAETGGVRLINLKGYEKSFSRKNIDNLTDIVKGYRAGGLAWLRLSGGEKVSSFGKFMTEAELCAIIERANGQDGDLIFIVADKNDDYALRSLGALRLECAKRLNLMKQGEFNFLWVTEFPLFEYSEEEDRLVACHHPFTSPIEEDLSLLKENPAAVRSNAYDMVINGYEVLSGSIRIFDPEIQSRVFEIIGFTPEETKARFGHMLTAFTYGVPPHGGAAFGFDRLIMLLAGTENIKDVIAFPKLQNATEPMMASPAPVDRRQLEDLHIKV